KPEPIDQPSADPLPPPPHESVASKVSDGPRRRNLLPTRQASAVQPAGVYDNASTDPSQRARQCLERGLDCHRRGDFAGACAELTVALALEPNLVEGYGHRGDAYLAAGKPRQALEDFSVLLQRAPHNATGYAGRAQAYVALDQ